MKHFKHLISQCSVGSMSRSQVGRSLRLSRLSILPISLFVLFVSFVVIVPTSHALEIQNHAVSNITTVAADIYCEVVSTNGTNPTVTVYYGTSDGTTNPASWSGTNIYGEAAVGIVHTNITGLTPASQYYYRWYADEGSTSVWAAASSNFWTLANVPSNAPTLTNHHVLVDGTGKVVSPSDFFDANGVPTNNAEARLAALEGQSWSTNGTNLVTAKSVTVGSTNAPEEALDIHGNTIVRGTNVVTAFKFTTGAAAGHVLLCDADGNAYWAMYATTTITNEADPVAIAALTNYLTAAQIAGLYATGTPVYVETDATALAEMTNYYLVSVADTNFAGINHDHDADYAALGHLHTGVYSPTNHNHDGSYLSIPGGDSPVAGGQIYTDADSNLTWGADAATRWSEKPATTTVDAAGQNISAVGKISIGGTNQYELISMIDTNRCWIRHEVSGGGTLTNTFYTGALAENITNGAQRSWSNVSNVFASDDAYAQVQTHVNETCAWLRVKSFGVDLGENYVVQGIRVHMEGYASTSIADPQVDVRLWNNGYISQTNTITVTNAAGGERIDITGDSNTIWALNSLTWWDVNQDDFAVDVRPQLFDPGATDDYYLDHLQVEVWYRPTWIIYSGIDADGAYKICDADSNVLWSTSTAMTGTPVYVELDSVFTNWLATNSAYVTATDFTAATQALHLAIGVIETNNNLTSNLVDLVNGKADTNAVNNGLTSNLVVLVNGKADTNATNNGLTSNETAIVRGMADTNAVNNGLTSNLVDLVNGKADTNAANNVSTSNLVDLVNGKADTNAANIAGTSNLVVELQGYGATNRIQIGFNTTNKIDTVVNLFDNTTSTWCEVAGSTLTVHNATITPGGGGSDPYNLTNQVDAAGSNIVNVGILEGTNATFCGHVTLTNSAGYAYRLWMAPAGHFAVGTNMDGTLGNSAFQIYPDGSVVIGENNPEANCQILGCFTLRSSLTNNQGTVLNTIAVTNAATFARDVTITSNLVVTGNISGLDDLWVKDDVSIGGNGTVTGSLSVGTSTVINNGGIVLTNSANSTRLSIKHPALGTAYYDAMRFYVNNSDSLRFVMFTNTTDGLYIYGPGSGDYSCRLNGETETTNWWVRGYISGIAVIDRTPFRESGDESIHALLTMTSKEGGGVDYSKLDDSLKTEMEDGSEGRNLSQTVSDLVQALHWSYRTITNLQHRIDKLEFPKTP